MVSVAALTLLPQNYSTLFEISVPDISCSDKESLTRSSHDIMTRMQTLVNKLFARSDSFTKQMLRLAFKFSGEELTLGVVDDISQEAITNKIATSSQHREERKAEQRLV
jgi:hypothetical protein